MCSSLGTMGTGTDGEGSSGIEINGGEDIHPTTVVLLLYGIQGNTVSGVQDLKSLRFSGYFLSLLSLYPAGTGNLGWCDAESTTVFHQATDGGRAGTVTRALRLYAV